MEKEKNEEDAITPSSNVAGAEGGANAGGGMSNEELMKQIVDLQKQMVDQQKRGLEDVDERRVNKYAVFLFVIAGFLLFWFFGSIVSLASRWMSNELLVHDHILMPIAATLMILAGVQLMTKKRSAKTMVGVALGAAALWNVVAAIHGYVVEMTRSSYWSMSGGSVSVALVLAIVRIVIYGLIIGGLALWFYKSKSIQKTISGWF